MKDFPLFPLNIFLLPGEFTQLYIFEERYKQLINESWESSKPFGIPFSNKLNARNLGTIVEVKKVLSRNPEGEMEIVVQAIGNFKLDRFYYQLSGKLYPAGDVQSIPSAGADQIDSELLLKFREYLVDNDHFDAELLARESFTYAEVAAILSFNEQEKMDFISLASNEEFRKYLLNYLRYLDLLHEQESKQFQNIYLN